MSGLSFKKDDTPKTYGEKMYGNIFETGINFGVNLAVSAAFTYWVKHSTRPILKDSKLMKGALNQSPAAFYEQLVQTFQKTPLMNALKTQEGKRNVAEAMANIFTLNFAGHGILIPSVWLGEKYKTNIIKHFDEKHYGEAQPDWVTQRHEAIQTAPKTSIAGAVTSRFGTLFATTATAYALGGRYNIIKTAGDKLNIAPLKKFEGFDKISGQLGEITGQGIEKIVPKEAINGLNKWARKAGFSHSPEQTAARAGVKPENIPSNIKHLDAARKGDIGNYKTAIPDVTRFTFLDALYSAVTALSLGPIMGAVKKLPGMTYQQDGKDQKPQKTIGETVHGAVTYGGADWLLNAAVGAGFAFAANRTGVGKRFYARPVENGLSKVFGKFIKDPETLKKSVSGGQKLISITVGGTAINPILTYLEDPEHKKGFVKSVDEMVHGKEAVANNPEFQAAYDAIDQQPNKNMASAWVSRFIALAPLMYISSRPQLLSAFSKNNVPVIKHASLDNISALSRKGFEKLGMKPKGWWNEKQMDATKGAMTSNWQALHDTIGFDFGLTPYYAIVHAATFPMVASAIGGTKTEKQTNQPSPATHGDDIIVNLKLAKPSTSVREATNISRLENPQEMQVAH